MRSRWSATEMCDMEQGSTSAHSLPSAADSEGRFGWKERAGSAFFSHCFPLLLLSFICEGEKKIPISSYSFSLPASPHWPFLAWALSLSYSWIAFPPTLTFHIFFKVYIHPPVLELDLPPSPSTLRPLPTLPLPKLAEFPVLLLHVLGSGRPLS